MMNQNHRFAQLLTDGVKAIKLRQHKTTIQVVHDEIGYALGKNGGSMVEYWRKGHIPASILEVERLAEEIVARSGLGQEWLLEFLKSAGHPYPEAFCQRLFAQPPAAPVSSQPSATLQADHLSPSLTWATLHQGCQQVTQKRTITLFKKFIQPIYQPRSEALAEFDRFLSTEHRFFVLVGKSGIGKSSFLVHRLIDLAGRQNEVCVLLYESHAFLPGQVFVGETIHQDFLGVLPGLPVHPSLFWNEVARTITDHGGQLILMVDAINENLDPLLLLQQLIYLADTLPVFPRMDRSWLKIILTSRAQVWRMLIRRPTFDGHKFYAPLVSLEGASADEGDPVSSATTLNRFTSAELPLVYQRYQQYYNLRTSFEHLTENYRTLLQDPLILNLLAKTYMNQEMRGLPQKRKILDDYLQALLLSRRLHPEDVYLLENEMVPRLVDGQVNQLSIDALAGENTYSGHSLYDLFFGPRLLAGALQPDTPFAHLVDSEILAVPDVEGGGVLRFQHEGVYEYFGSRYLVRLASALASQPRESVDEQLSRVKAAWYAQLIQQVQNKHYMWGVIQQALYLEVTVQHDSNLLASLLHLSPDRLTKTIIARILVELGRDDTNAAMTVLNDLLDRRLGLHDSVQKSITNRFRRPAYTSAEMILARQIALEVARQLGLDSILLQYACSEIEPVRQYAIQQILYLWYQDEERCLRLLMALAEYVQPFHRLGFVSRSYRSLVSLGHISLFIVLSNYRAEEESQVKGLKQVRASWQPVIERLFYFDPTTNQVATALERLRPPLRDLFIFKVITPFFTRALRAPGRATLNSNLAEFQAFYKLPAEYRDKVSHLLQFLEPECSLNLQEYYPLILEVARQGNRLPCMVVEYGLRCQHFHGAPDVLSFLQQLFVVVLEAAQAVHPSGLAPAPNLMMASILETMFTLADNLGGTVNQSALDAYGTMMVTFYDYGDGLWVQGLYGKYMINHFAKFVSVYHRRYNSLPEELILKYTDRLCQEKESPFAAHFLVDIQTLLTNPGYTWAGLEILKHVIDFQGQSEVDEKIFTLLARFGGMYPERLDTFLVNIQAPLDFRKRLDAMETPEHVSNVFFLYGITGGSVLDRSPLLWRELAWIFKTAFQCTTLSQLTMRMIQHAINLIYGSSVFQVPR